jgi:hypothetical protein
MQRRLDRWVAGKLEGREDPMRRQLVQAGLPFRRRIEQVLAAAGLTWDEWRRDPRRETFDRAASRSH